MSKATPRLPIAVQAICGACGRPLVTSDRRTEAWPVLFGPGEAHAICRSCWPAEETPESIAALWERCSTPRIADQEAA